MRLVVDSSVFVAAFRDQEPHSMEAFRFLSDLEKSRHEAVVPVSVILEVVAAVSRRTRDSELGRRVGTRLASFRTLKLVELTESRMRRMFHVASEYGLAGMDAILVGTAEEFDIPLLTFDRQIVERAKDEVEVLSVPPP
jgi:predicted nucleic acid-binding protein